MLVSFRSSTNCAFSAPFYSYIDPAINKRPTTARTRIPQKWAPVLLRNPVYADCVDLSAAEYAQQKMLTRRRRERQLRGSAVRAFPCRS